MNPAHGAQPQIAVLDTGGQYCHLITRKIRELGVYSEIRPSETPAESLRNLKGIIISGGPGSVYEDGSPTIDPAILTGGTPVLGICYGQQLMAHFLGGKVEKGLKGEYGLAWLTPLPGNPLFREAEVHQQIWMSHRDTVTAAPPGFNLYGTTETCPIAAIADPARRLFGVQFHPEVVHTQFGQQILSNFLFDICGCVQDWNTSEQVARIEAEIGQVAAGRKVFFFVSGGVDSTVAFTLCMRALGANRVRGLYVDTGLMRAGETSFVADVFAIQGGGAFSVEHAEDRFLSALEGVVDPEQKRKIIGEKFVEVQEAILESGHFLDDDWILGQGTIYPDTIESGGTAKADLIKTHHNRVAGIQRLIDEGRIVEPLRFLYKDEVRAVGAQLGLPDDLLERHPFPGPGLAIRCLCSTVAAPVQPQAGGFLAPVRSVGVQGDSRSYRPVLIIEDPAAQDRATEAINNDTGINRVIGCARTVAPLDQLKVHIAPLSRSRLEVLRKADEIVRRLSHQNKFDCDVWQFPVILLPLGTEDRRESVVLRPVDSVDGMTARSVPIPPALLKRICDELMALPEVSAVFCDLTHKPPGTIEWE